MLFNTPQFAVFFVIVYILYLVLSHKLQNRMLLVASYVFYGAWDWRFLSILIISTLMDYVCSLKIYGSDNPRVRKIFLVISLSGSLTILGFFKYFNFFVESFEALLLHCGLHVTAPLLHVILPVGISFYTFQSMSYVLDVYRKQAVPTKNLLDFALYVSFFPQLVAGPIERARHLLPQILLPRNLSLDMFYEGCYLIFWGLFEKMFIADNLAKIVEPVFSGRNGYNGSEVLLALYAFAFQIFCDFDGYSNMARGLARLLGVDIIFNFKLPYFATNPREFWHRWHISLSTWLRDYLYIPLGGSRRGEAVTCMNLAITMFIGGLWHGAGWIFVFWGMYQGLLLILHRLAVPVLEKMPPPRHALAEKAWFGVRVILFFQVTCLGWLIFRAKSMTQVWQMLRSIFFNFHITPEAVSIFQNIAYFTFFLLFIQVLQGIKDDILIVMKWPKYAKAVFVLIIVGLFIHNMFYGKYTWLDSGEQFIYFQF